MHIRKPFKKLGLVDLFTNVLLMFMADYEGKDEGVSDNLIVMGLFYHVTTKPF